MALNTRSYIAIWLALFVLDLLIVGLGPWRRIHSLASHDVVLTGHVAGLPDSGARMRAPYIYVYNGQTYAGRGRSFAPNLPARYLTSGQAVEVSVDSRNPSRSVLGDARVAQRGANRLLALSAIFGPSLITLVVYLICRRKTNPTRPQMLAAQY